MNEIYDSTEHFLYDNLIEFRQDLPEPLDYWSLRDFADIVPNVSYAS